MQIDLRTYLVYVRCVLQCKGKTDNMWLVGIHESQQHIRWVYTKCFVIKFKFQVVNSLIEPEL